MLGIKLKAAYVLSWCSPTGLHPRACLMALNSIKQLLLFQIMVKTHDNSVAHNDIIILLRGQLCWSDSALSSVCWLAGNRAVAPLQGLACRADPWLASMNLTSGPFPLSLILLVLCCWCNKWLWTWNSTNVLFYIAGIKNLKWVRRIGFLLKAL